MSLCMVDYNAVSCVAYTNAIPYSTIPEIRADG